MSYDPIIHFYDDPGHPYWPSKNGDSGGGGSEQYGTGIEMAIKSNVDITLTFAVLTTTDVTDEDSYNTALIGCIACKATSIGAHGFVKGGAHIAMVGGGFYSVTMTLDDAEFTDFEVKTIGVTTYVLFTVPETGDPDSYLELNFMVD